MRMQEHGPGFPQPHTYLCAVFSDAKAAVCVHQEARELPAHLQALPLHSLAATSPLQLTAAPPGAARGARPCRAVTAACCISPGTAEQLCP